MSMRLMSWLVCVLFAALHVVYQTGEAGPWLAAGFVITAMLDIE
jgi:hypothetical protein